ncbi:MAG: adenylosuccinate lyase [Clostridiaceae bacterium]|nr:adenylosuccinate lyase [Clostridiaceae bacterium]MDD6703735.1 adenylosuccinate lyase [Clostridiaceae bacterium]MDD7615106.1 adenylosuccinate lyase [Clostridiaceae bacterium]MDY5888573.1 adenylosuccinate lyase [Oscillospiraceae bacterium]
MKNTYETPLNSRYASKEMQYLFSPDFKFKTWRRLWIALAESEMELGLNITQEQIDELKAHAEDINYEVAAEREKLVRHDVMSHVYAYGVQCPKAKGIIHLGATSCYVGDNTDIITMTEALKLIRKKLVNLMDKLSKFALEYKALPCLGFTHFQPAQPTTLGKRASLWLNELLLDFEQLEFQISQMKLLGSKGTTGTQASFMDLFEGDTDKVKALDKKITEKMGYTDFYPVSGQTYSRKVDTQVLFVLSGIAQSAAKFTNDLRLLQHLKEVEEPFEKNQIGSSAMAYKRNPMRSERISSLARYVMADVMNPTITAATQWFERTLDDSANKRISVAEAFLATDAILELYINVADGMVVYPKMIEKHLMAELPFMATENIMMEAVKRGGDRQELHERIRVHSMDAGKIVKQDGGENDLLERIANDPAFGVTLDQLKAIMKPELYVGRAPQQTEEFVENYIKPITEKYSDLLGMNVEIKV